MQDQLKARLLELPVHPRTHALLRVMMGEEPATTPYFTGRAVVTSDGFIMGGFVDGQGRHHLSAFIGSWDELMEDLKGLSYALELDEAGRQEVIDLAKGWIATDYRI